MRKIDLITGFLGSGKTTFLLKYAKYLMDKGQRIGILEYDYGAINVDMMLLQGLRGDNCELEMVAAGCDEDCLRRRFKTKLIAMAMSGYDRVIVEPSGVFDMDMFFDVLREEPLENFYEIGSVITIVDGMLKADLSAEEDYFLASQAAGAGTIVFSRTQLCGEGQMEGVKQHILKAVEGIGIKNFDAKYLEKEWDKLSDEDFEKLSECGYKIRDYVKSIAGSSLSFSSVYCLDIKDNREKIERKIQTLFANRSYGNIIRVKGFVVEGTQGYQINASMHETRIEPIDTTEAVVIVIGSDLAEKEIQKLMEE